MVDTLLDRCPTLGVAVSFDVNHRPGLWAAAEAAPALLDLARRSAIVLVGLDEAQALWDVRTAEDVASLVEGTGLVVVKDAAREAVDVDRAPARTTRVPA